MHTLQSSYNDEKPKGASYEYICVLFFVAKNAVTGIAEEVAMVEEEMNLLKKKNIVRQRGYDEKK